ncbi:MAG: hypothetical protein OHK0013_18020 [Sandaracinaceae bacterium]
MRSLALFLAWAHLLASTLVLAACPDTVAPDDAALPDASTHDALIGHDAASLVDAYVDPPCTTSLEDPDDGRITTWPEVALLADDPTTETGHRLSFDPARYPALVPTLGGYLATLTEDLAEVDGFGVNAEVFVQFGRAFDVARLPAPEQTARAGAPLGLVVIEPGPPRLVPVLVSTTDLDRTLLMAPAEPLPPRARVAAFVTQALAPAARGCIEPSAADRVRLAGPLDAHAQAALDALVGLGVVRDARELVSLVAYPTQSIVDDGLAVRAALEDAPASWETPPRCVEEPAWRRCEGLMRASTFQDPADGVIRRARGAPAAPTGTYLVPVTAWLPREGGGPVRTLVYGHGLTGTREQAAQLASFAAPLGIATVAIDAPEHGDHPSVEEPGRGDLETLLAFFGIDATRLRTRALEAARLRDNFQAAAFDRLQLVGLLAREPDLTGDGAPDLDPDRVAYLGVSLGGIMGAQHLALDARLGAGVLVVGGGRVSAIISDSAMFGALVTTLRPRSATEGDVRRFFPILQTILERGDAASWAPYVTRDALAGTSRDVDVLLGVVLDDEIVPNVSNYTLARAFGMPLVEPVLRPVPAVVSAPAPLRGNVREGRATAGMLQFDVVGDGMGGTEPADHGNVGASDVGADAWLDFLTSHWGDAPRPHPRPVRRHRPAPRHALKGSPRRQRSIEVGVRIVTSSSAAVGWIPIVVSSCALVAPHRSATAKPCTISPASAPATCTPSTRSVSASTTSFMKQRSSEPVNVCFIGLKSVLKIASRWPRARASVSVRPTVATAGEVNTAVGMPS